MVGINSGSSVGGVGIYVPEADVLFPCDVPFRCIGGIVDLDGLTQINRRLKQLLHKLLNIFLINPGSAQPDIDFGGIQILWLRLFQCSNVILKNSILLSGLSGLGKLFAYIAGKIFICCDIVWNGILRKIRNLEDNTTEFCGQIGGRLSRQLGHIIHIYTGVLCNGYGQSFRCGINRGDGAGLTDGALCKHICFPKKLVVLI